MRRGTTVVAGVAAAVAALCGCSGPAPAARAPATIRPAPTDRPGAVALLRIAQTFNNDYDNGDFGAVYDRWDARSQALLTRADYIRRHVVCAPATHEQAQVEEAVPAGPGVWHVTYQIAGQQLIDTWYYQRRRWVFDIVASNPGAARLYGMPFSQYAKATGCSTK